MSVNSGWNVDEKIGMNPSRTIVIPLPHITRISMSNCDIFDLFIRGLPYHGTIKSESEILVENIRDNKIFKNAERENNFEIEKVGRKNSVNWNHTNSILN